MEAILNTYREKIDRAFEEYLPAEDCFPSTIHKAMRYTLFAGGKRLRGVLAVFTAELFAVDESLALQLAVAIECAHTYSLIHDDLPAMDDDDFRRDQPANHKVFGEAVAILAGDALLTLAFQLIAELNTNSGKVVRILREFSRALGSQGMVGGQLVDIESEGENVDIPILQYIHTHKTGALINFSVNSGALLGDKVTSEQYRALNDYGERIGLAFQVVDDILDVTGNLETLGKKNGQDVAHHKVTYISQYGLEESREQVKTLVSEAKEAINIFPGCEKLAWLAEYIEQRTF